MSDKSGHPGEQLSYRSYLLRLWWLRGGETQWRASLESAQTGERVSFLSLDALFDYIRNQTCAGPSPVRRGKDDPQAKT